jgi:P4 family phage/plasmid primase-like protien
MTFTSEFIEAVIAATVARNGRREGEEIRFTCPDPSHHANGDVHASAHLNVRKLVWHCPVGDLGGGLLDLANRLGVATPERIKPPTPETFAHQRGLTVAALKSWGVRGVVHAHRPALRYPTPVGVERLEFTDGRKPKYVWAAKGGRIHWYGLARALGHIRENGDRVLYLVNGEPSVWAAEMRGVAAACLCGGEGAKFTRERLAQLQGALTGLAMLALRIVFDADEPGRLGAIAARRALLNAGFEDIDALDIAGAVPDHVGADVDDLQRRVGAQLAATLAALPSLADAASGDQRDRRAESSHRQPRSAPSLFDEGGRFVPAWAGKQLLAEAHIHLGHDRRLWRYTDGVYRPDGDDWAKQRVRELVGDAFRRQQLDQVTAWLRARLPTLGHQAPLHLINCRNGLLDWRTSTLSPHTPLVLSTNQLPIAWNPDATCLTIRRFFAETLPWDTLDFIEELFGYALYPGNPFRKAVLLFGLGANGKSVLLRLFTGLLGPENVSAVSLQALGEHRFAAGDLFGKLANICGDLDARAIEHTDFFKQITGGDLVRAEFKFRDAFTFQSYALPLFSANELPRTADQTDAWFDRWVVLPMTRRFEGAADDPTLATTLAAELEGVLVHAVVGLHRLMTHGRFRLPSSVVAAGRCYRQTLDTVRSFIAEECHLERTGLLERAALYKRYREWCQDSGRFPLAATTFNQHLEQAFGDRIGQRTRRGRPGWLGLAWGIDPNADGAGGGRGDEGDALPTLSLDTQSGAGCGERGGTSSPSSPQPPPADREPGDDHPVLDLAEALDWPCVPLRPGLTILGNRAHWITFVRTASLRDREAAQAYLEHLGRDRTSGEEQ